jgi:large subunit ribosomal protein L4
MKAKIYNLKGETVGDIELKDSVFNLPANDGLVHQVYTAISSNRRQVLAHTKNRGDRAGSGIKPWKQKGTGRARVGSVRTPTWRKGGVAFGPRNDRNFKKKINQKMNAKAITIALSGKIREEDLTILDNFQMDDMKTKTMAHALKALKIEKSALVVFDSAEKDLRRYSRNITKVTNSLVSQLNVFDILNCRKLVMTKNSVVYLETKYAGQEKEVTNKKSNK